MGYKLHISVMNRTILLDKDERRKCNYFPKIVEVFSILCSVWYIMVYYYFSFFFLSLNFDLLLLSHFAVYNVNNKRYEHFVHVNQ